VFFNPFSEAEPFEAILIAHGTRVFLGDSWGQRPENKFEADGGERGKGSWGRAVSPSPPASGYGGAL